MDEEHIVMKWENIAKYSPYDKQLLRKKYGKDMLSKGFVLKTRIGRQRSLVVWGYPEQIKKYFTLTTMEKGVL